MNSTLPVDRDILDQLVAGRHGNPHAVLGAHPHAGAVTVRALRPLAESVVVVHDGGRVSLEHEHGGVWAGVLDVPAPPDYRLEVTYPGGPTAKVDDAYRFLPTLGEVDLHLVNEGRHEQLWRVLGAHLHIYDGPGGTVRGTSFAVWAPAAKGVRVKSDFNTWDGREHWPMRQLGVSGVWELFVPEVGSGTRYKFAVLGADGVWREKADPMAFHTEVPPLTSSVVFDSTYTWADDAWMQRRGEQGHPHERPMSVYEMHLGSWRRHGGQAPLSYTELADELVPYLQGLDYTHVEFLPVMEHPYGGSWGYHVTGFFAPTARFGDPDGFRHLVDRLHQAGIGVILDWVPGHFATDEWALARFDGSALYEHPDPRRGWHPEWGSYIFDFGRKEVRNFLVANAAVLAARSSTSTACASTASRRCSTSTTRARTVSGLPNSVRRAREPRGGRPLAREANATLLPPRSREWTTVAEESTAWPGVTRSRPTSAAWVSGFKWNMGWMHDSLGLHVAHDPVHRQYHHNQMTFSLVYAYSENYMLPISHDEVVHGKGSLLRKMPGDRWQQLANLRTFLAYMWAHPGKQLLFMGSEFGQESEWAEGRELDWWLLENADHRGVSTLVRDMNRIYRDSPALWSLDSDPAGFSWIDANDSANNVFSFLRHGTDGSVLACVANFAALPHHDYRIGLSSAGTWTEVLNTDSAAYAGSGVGNLGSVTALAKPWHGQPASASLTVPPLGALWLQFQRDAS